MAIGSTWFTNKDQYNTFKSSLERSQLIVKQAQAIRMEADIAALDEKYDGKKAAGIEDEINKIYDKKSGVSSYLSSVEQGVKRMDDVRTELLMAKAAIAMGSGPALDLAINSINQWVGRQSANPTSLIANNGTNSGTWAKDVTVLTGAGMTVPVAHQFMGSDYALVFPDGSVSRAEKTGTSLSGGQLDGAKMSDLTLTVDAGGNYSVFNAQTGKTDAVEVRRGGVGLLNAWGYGNLQNPDDRARAQADIDSAFKKLAKMERDLNSYQAGLSGIVNGLDGKSQQLSKDYKKITEEDLSAKQAERRAIETRFKISTNSLALANDTVSTFIYQMFNTSATTTP